MSDEIKQEAGNAAPETMEVEHAGAVPARRGKRRNCMVVPGSSDPLVAKMFSHALMKEVMSKYEDEAAPENPEAKEEEMAAE